MTILILDDTCIESQIPSIFGDANIEFLHNEDDFIKMKQTNDNEITFSGESFDEIFRCGIKICLNGRCLQGTPNEIYLGYMQDILHCKLETNNEKKLVEIMFVNKCKSKSSCEYSICFTSDANVDAKTTKKYTVFANGFDLYTFTVVFDIIKAKE